MILNLNKDEKEFFYTLLLNNHARTFSPFEIDEEVDFPKKDELGGDIIKFIGGGSGYIKIQTEMPSPEEVEDVRQVALFLKKKFGDYVVVQVLCTPDIEIYDINIDKFVGISVDYMSARKSKGDLVIDDLLSKLENNEELSQSDHFFRIFLPFMGRNNDSEFEIKYSKIIDLYSKSNQELPSVLNLSKFDFLFLLNDEVDIGEIYEQNRV